MSIGDLARQEAEKKELTAQRGGGSSRARGKKKKLSRKKRNKNLKFVGG